ncbi:MAG: GNAT family N-acetyltransferase [Alphaproteobacteria bacterium]|nr:GNAT family N-acetyltransferase [Alphaproteobacteria bacterium]
MSHTTEQQRVSVAIAETDADVAAVKAIFRAFVEFLPIDLGFQGIEAEMARFPEGYEFLLLAKRGEEPIGAVALKEHSPDVCEMKRLYVLPEGQRTGAGRLLCEHLMQEAKARGYTTMLLDSLKRLEAAVALYRKLGFEEIEPYNFNPEDDVVYMKRTL